MKKFNARIPWWLSGIIIAAYGYAIYEVGQSINLPNDVSLWQLPLIDSPFRNVLLPILILSSAVTLVCLKITYYVDQRSLTIKSVLVNQQIPLDRIKKVTRTTSLFSTPTATDIKRLVIHYKADDTVQISPTKEAEFLTAIGHQITDS